MNIKDRFPETDDIWKYSNPVKAQENAYKYYGEHATLYRSNRKDKKYYIITPDNKKVHFGQMGYIDFTKSNDTKKRESYLKRSGNIKGNWKDNIYSPNNLSRKILW